MNFEEKLRRLKHHDIWQEYCGFLDLSIQEYMQIQNRLMQEQIRVFSESELGKVILKGKTPQTVQEFRTMISLTEYGDYADILLQKKEEMLPGRPTIWIQTTWEGGRHPIKVAPYTTSMLETFRDNLMAILILASSSERGKFNISAKDKILYGLAPLPYLTGLIPASSEDEISMTYLPPVKEAIKMSFSERNKLGFKMGLSQGIDYFFAMGSVSYYISKTLSSLGNGSGHNKTKTDLVKLSPLAVLKVLKAKYRSKKEGRDIMPKDLYKLKGFLCAGTDNAYYKDDLEELWGVRPLEIFAGTEPSCIGTETWNKNGMYFFPDVCFYEFIPEIEMNKSIEDTSYEPYTCLMDEVKQGEKYEIVISIFKGGAFMRYRVGDVYECMGLESFEDQTKIPRFRFIDRVPNIIDIAGFTRISEHSINSVIKLSRLEINGWFAVKEYKDNKRPILHLFIEMEPGSLSSMPLGKDILKDHLSAYFNYLDHDYKDLQKILGVDPLEITFLKYGTLTEYKRRSGKTVRKMNPPSYEVTELLKMQTTGYPVERGKE